MKESFYHPDTIVALATPVGDGAIGVIRISGPDSLKILKRIFKGKTSPENFQSHHLYFGKIFNPHSQKLLDEVLVSYMKSPRSFTGEDVVEIQAHGGSFGLTQLIKVICEEGARLAEPGEFSKRAYLNGKIDLAQAEAISDLIHAKNEWALNNALDQIDGKLSEMISVLRDKILKVCARVELGFDFTEEDLEFYSREEVTEIILEIKKECLKLIDSFQTGKLYKEGLKIAIVGRPNVGKSSLLNLILRENRAIVHHSAGTTRDVVFGERLIHGINAHFYDTAGIREGESEIEEVGIEKTWEVIKKADLILMLFDTSSEFNQDDEEILNQIQSDLPDVLKIIVGNKSDLTQKWDFNDKFQKMNKIKISVHEEQGFDKLLELIYEKTIKNNVQKDHNYVLNNVRHKSSLENVVLNIERLCHDLNSQDIPEEILAEELKLISNYLNEIIGKIDVEDILSDIFSNFCIGK